MCLIIHRELGSKVNVPTTTIDYNLRKNPDGFGMAWRDAKSGQLQVEKFGPKEGKAFKKLLKKVDAQKGVEYVAHFRLATHGPVCKDMSHPFSYEDANGETTLVFHNGIIQNNPPKTESDTSYFVKEVLSGLIPLWWHNPAYTNLVEKYIGWSRLVIMTPRETFRMVEKDWKKLGGLYYSTDPGPMGMPVVKQQGAAKSTTLSGTYRSAKDAWETWENSFNADADEFGFDVEDQLLPDVVGSFKSDYKHEGHDVSRVSEYAPTDWKGEAAGKVICNPCQTIGDYYKIDGQLFTDLQHITEYERHV